MGREERAVNDVKTWFADVYCCKYWFSIYYT